MSGGQETPSNESLLQALENFESQFHGKTLRINRLAIHIGTGGGAVTSEFVDGPGSGQYANQSYALNANNNTDTVLKRDVLYLSGVVIRDPISAVISRATFGRSRFDLERFSTIARSAESATFGFVEQFGVNCGQLVFQIPGKGKYAFYFNLDGESPKLIGVEFDKRVGDSIRILQADLVIGKDEEYDIGNGLKQMSTYNVVKRIWMRVGPFSFNESGSEFEVPYESQYEYINQATKTAKWKDVYIVGDLERTIRTNQIEIENIQLKDNQKVTMYRTGIPHTIINKQLVASFNGLAIDEANGVGFRKRSGWRYYWLLLLGGGIGVLLWLRLRNK